MQSELAKAAREFMFLFIVDGGDRGISLDDINPMEFSQKFAALEAALSAGEMQEICSVSFADREASTMFLRDFTKSEGGLATVDWYALRDRIADKISMTRVEERDLCRAALSTDAEPAKTAPAVAVKADAETIAKIIDPGALPGTIGEASAIAKAGKVIAALSAQVQGVAGWQPIETADKNAPRLLLGIVRREVLEETHVGGYRWAVNEDDVSCWWSDQADDEIAPTHWMPLPTFPASKHGDAE